jgi:short-chain fatty acids transporter
LTPGEKIENARIINIVVGIVGIIFLSRHFVGGGSLTINITNMLFFILAILLTDTPRRFIDNCIEGGKSLGPLAMQFPLYAGIMAMMIQTGLATKIANGFVSISTTTTFPLWTFISAGITNFFIPSGGSQWSVQGPIMIEAAKMMDADLARTAMAVAWGDQWTNMLQPFWALPLLAIANLRARDIMGYLVLVFILSGIVFGLGIMFLP